MRRTKQTLPAVPTERPSHLGETKPVVIATADPGTRSTPTAEDAPLDQQLLGKSLSAQRILAERKAPASQTGKVSVDEPVGSSPAAMDPASARSVAGTPMAPPPEVIKETRSA